MKDRHFQVALAATLKIEGVYSADHLDPGGETFMGISRVYWPKWSGWAIIDEWKRTGGTVPDLSDQVEEFYHTNFWCRFQGDAVAIASPAVAMEIFDTAVNMGLSDAVRFFQTALNMQNQGAKLYADLQVDGRVGPKTINCLSRYLAYNPGSWQQNETILLNCMNGEQYIAYRNNPQHEYFRGWFCRV